MQLAKELLKSVSRRDLPDSSTTLVHTPPSVQPIAARIQRFQDELHRPIISVQALKKLAIHGIPDKPGLRALTWKLLLGYLPEDVNLWDEHLARKRNQYQLFCEELIIKPNKSGEENKNGNVPHSSQFSEAVKELNPSDVTHDDHPLSLGQESKWNNFFKDAEIMEQIDRDVMRTHPDMHFFSGDDTTAETHREEMKRALFIFAKLNPGLRYIQGMNELYAPLYYLFKTDPDSSASRHAEADAFYCFVDLLSEFRDHFCQQLDNSQSGIRATIGRLVKVAEYYDPPLLRHIQHVNKINPQFFAFRWITLLLTQEFSFPDAVRIWDTLLSDPNGRSDCLLRVCCAMLQNVRDQLLEGDFAANVKLLQHYPSVDINTILSRAAMLRPCAEVLGQRL